MSMNILNDISAVYLQQVAEKKDDSYLETDMKKRHENNEKAREEMKRTKANKDMVKAARKSMGVEDDDDDDDDINEATYSAKAARAGKDIGKPGKTFEKIAKSASERYGSEERGKKVAGAVLAKLRKEALDPVGKEDADIDNDGDTDSSDKYLHKRRKAIGKAISKNSVKEGFSNWRQDLAEVMDDVEASKEIKEKTVNNKITINPEMKEAVEQLGGELIEMVEVDEAVYGGEKKEPKDTRFTVTAADKKGNTTAYQKYKAGDERYKAAPHLKEEINVATEYFYEQGLNEYGIDILIEQLGIEEFADFVYEIVDEYTLSEARTLLGKKKNPQKLPKGTSPTTLTKAAVKKYGTTRKMTSSPSSSTVKKNRVAVKKAVVKQPETKSTSTQTKTGIAGRIGAALGAAVKKGREDIKRVQDAAQTARDVATRRGAEAKAVYDAVRERGKKAEQSATATRARRKATVAAGRAAQAAAPVVKKAVKAGAAAAGAGAGSLKAGKSPAAAAGKAAGTFVRKMTKEELELQEKAESEQQQKLFGLALSVKRGDTPRSEASDAVLKIVDSMSEKKIRDFAKTKHEGIPKKVEEELAPTTPQQFTAQKQLAMAQKRLTAADQLALKTRKKEMQQQEEFVSEEDYDRMKDERMMRGGIDGNTNYRQPSKSGSSKPVDREKQKETARRALELVRQQTMSKYGKGSLM